MDRSLPQSKDYVHLPDVPRAQGASVGVGDNPHVVEAVVTEVELAGHDAHRARVMSEPERVAKLVGDYAIDLAQVAHVPDLNLGAQVDACGRVRGRATAFSGRRLDGDVGVQTVLPRDLMEQVEADLAFPEDDGLVDR